MSWQARGGTFAKQLAKRQKFLERRLANERSTLGDVLAEVGHPHHEAVWMLELKIGQTDLELKWLNNIIQNALKRAPARHAES